MCFGERDMTAVFLSYNAKTHNSMNDFEKRMNELRIQFRDERVSISSDSYRKIGRLNRAIGLVDSAEAREALRTEKERTYEAMRNSHKYNRICYLEQLELLEDQYALHRKANPSKKQLRRMMATVCASVEASGADSCSIAFGDNRRATITFS